MDKTSKGLTHLYFGDGKGKTTAAMGLLFRACGSGKRAAVLSFLKGRDSGEYEALKKMNVPLFRAEKCEKFVFQMTKEEKKELKEAHNTLLKKVIRLALDQKIDLLVLDEIAAAYELDVVDRVLVKTFAQSKPESLELVLTGRNPAPFMFEIADYISEIVKIRHPYDQGIGARKGVEY